VRDSSGGGRPGCREPCLRQVSHMVSGTITPAKEGLRRAVPPEALLVTDRAA